MFEFTDSSCVVIGTFNIYIIQPHWLAEVGIIPKDQPVRMRADLRNPGFKFQTSGSPDTHWEVRPDRLQVQSKNFGTDCGKPIAEVLEHLFWTPIMAVGCNATFKAPLDALPKLLYLFGTGAKSSGYDETQKTWHRTLKRDRFLFNVQLSTQENRIELSLNAHTEAKDEKDIRAANKIAAQSCAHFLQQRDESISLAKSLLDVEIG